jgi:acyl carrier protein
VHEQFVTILRRHLKYLPPRRHLAADAALGELGLDSLAAVSLILALEDELGITLPDNSLAGDTLRTPATLWAVVSGQLLHKPA